MSFVKRTKLSNPNTKLFKGIYSLVRIKKSKLYTLSRRKPSKISSTTKTTTTTTHTNPSRFFSIFPRRNPSKTLTLHQQQSHSKLNQHLSTPPLRAHNIPMVNHMTRNVHLTRRSVTSNNNNDNNDNFQHIETSTSLGVSHITPNPHDDSEIRRQSQEIMVSHTAPKLLISLSNEYWSGFREGFDDYNNSNKLLSLEEFGLSLSHGLSGGFGSYVIGQIISSIRADSGIDRGERIHTESLIYNSISSMKILSNDIGGGTGNNKRVLFPNNIKLKLLNNKINGLAIRVEDLLSSIVDYKDSLIKVSAQLEKKPIDHKKIQNVLLPQMLHALNKALYNANKACTYAYYVENGYGTGTYLACINFYLQLLDERAMLLGTYTNKKKLFTRAMTKVIDMSYQLMSGRVAILEEGLDIPDLNSWPNNSRVNVELYDPYWPNAARLQLQSSSNINNPSNNDNDSNYNNPYDDHNNEDNTNDIPVRYTMESDPNNQEYEYYLKTAARNELYMSHVREYETKIQARVIGKLKIDEILREWNKMAQIEINGLDINTNLLSGKESAELLVKGLKEPNELYPIILYDHLRYSGLVYGFMEGRYNNVNQITMFQRETSSLKINNGYKVILFEKQNIGGSEGGTYARGVEVVGSINDMADEDAQLAGDRLDSMEVVKL